MRIKPILLASALLLTSGAASAQPPNPKATLDAQREALRALASLDGVWRGPAWTLGPNGREDIIQTERVGPMLDGTLKVIEGRGYEKDGSVGFNAFAVISYNPASKAYTMRSWAQGNTGDFPVKPTADGFSWEIPAGPGAIIRYTATIGPNDWKEVGEYIVAAGPPRQILEMNLKRVGKTAWPAADPIPRN
jgi:hypothetical protein